MKSHVAVEFSYVAACRYVEDPFVLEDGVRTSQGAVTELRYPRSPPQVNPPRNLRVSYNYSTPHPVQNRIRQTNKHREHPEDYRCTGCCLEMSGGLPNCLVSHPWRAVYQNGGSAGLEWLPIKAVEPSRLIAIRHTLLTFFF